MQLSDVLEMSMNNECGFNYSMAFKDITFVSCYLPVIRKIIIAEIRVTLHASSKM